MPFSSSSSSSWAASAVRSGEVKPRGNACFMASMQSSNRTAGAAAATQAQRKRQTCLLVGHFPPDEKPVAGEDRKRSQEVLRAAVMRSGDNTSAPVLAARQQRVHSSSSSLSSVTYSSDYSYSKSLDEWSEKEKITISTTTTSIGPDGTAIDADCTAETTAERKQLSTVTRSNIVPQTALSCDPYTQVQQEQHHPRLTAEQLRSGNEGAPMKLATAAAAFAGVPGWWSCESSWLPDGSTVPSSSSTHSTTSNMEADFMHKSTLLAEAKERGNAVGPITTPVSTFPRIKASVADEEAVSSPSSCGCPTNCLCRIDDANNNGVVEHLSHPQKRRDAQRNSTISDKRGFLNTRSKIRSFNSDDTESNFDASVTGTTPANSSRSSDDDNSAACCSRCRSNFSTSESSTLCSSCAAAARTHVLHFSPYHNQRHSGQTALSVSQCRHGQHHDKPFAEQDVFLDALEGQTMWTEVPPLLHLSLPPNASQRKDDAEVLAERERAQLGAEYIRQAALLAAGNKVEAEPSDQSITMGASVQRCSTSTQTEKGTAEDARQQQAVEEAKAREKTEDEEQLRGLAVAQCAEVALPMIQRELESYAIRTSAQQKRHVNALLRQLRSCQVEIHYQQKRQAAELQRHRVQWEHEQEEERRRQTSRKNKETFIDRDDKPAVAASTAARAAAAAARRAVGTQHSDGSLERLAIVQSDAAAWLASHLFSMEENARRSLEKAEKETRHQLLHVLEGPSRQVLMKCHFEVLQWHQKCVQERQTASCMAEFRVLQLQETIARKELVEYSKDDLHDLWNTFQGHLRHIEVAAAQLDLRQARIDLETTTQQLVALHAEHTDALQHVQQLRLQLLHALRMPTIVLDDHISAATSSRVPLPGAVPINAAYAYATATSGYEADEGKQRASGEFQASAASTRASASSVLREVEDLPVHRRFARAHQEALRVVRAQCRTV